ncbi:MAG: hypothetical protein Q8O61_11795 [Nocardioides sp.]|nr:hypothetical protein [Nocardioides sp.]
MSTVAPVGSADPVGAMFASRSVPVHVARGIAGLVLLISAFALAHVSALWLLLIPVTVVLWRGCVSCWTLGLIATRARTCPIR